MADPQAPSIRIITGDCLDVLPTLPARSVQCVVTSPPYFGLRDYGTATWEGGDLGCDHRQETQHQKQGATSARAGRANANNQRNENFRHSCLRCGALRVDNQIGLEPTPEAYVARLVEVFRAVRRVLRDDGILWLNLGDSYNAYNGNRGASKSLSANLNDEMPALPSGYGLTVKNLKPKDLIGIPWRVAFALQTDGWHLRSDVIWHKPNPMPESMQDRPTSSHEHVFMLTKQERYFYDAEAVAEKSESGNGETRNRRNVWTIPTQPFSGGHFATMPPAVAELCIRASTSEMGCCPGCGAPWARTITKGEPDRAHQAACGADASGGYRGRSRKNHDAAGVQNASDVKRRILAGMRMKSFGWQPSCKCPLADPVPCTVLDPFSGAATTALAADRLRRLAIGIELNPEYRDLGTRRIEDDAGLFASVG